tara:strand:+ start:1228 stop:2106 length:879 start_codon:yes stop_codon:yes gene_type:complete
MILNKNMKNIIRNSLSSKYQRFVKRGFSGITASSRVLPDFIIIGTVRSGSTSLYHNICEHPSIIPAAYDEIGYFDSNYHLGINWYRSMFPTNKEMMKTKKDTGHAKTGEDTPFYIWNLDAAKRIYKDLPYAKIISIFRNPIDRAYSNYNVGKRAGTSKEFVGITEKLSFEDAIDKEIEFMKNNSLQKSIEQRGSYLSKGHYAQQLKIWLDIFPKEQIHVLSTEDMEKSPETTISKIFQFLDIPEYTIKNPQRQKYFKYPQMKTETRAKLVDYYKPLNEEFFKMIGKKFNWEV